MFTSHLENVVKQSMVYSFALSQPVTILFSATLFEQNEFLIDQPPQQLGDQGEVVRLIQLKLNNLGYYDKLIDGEYDLLTKYALQQFQSSHNIEVTGTTNQQTMETLIEVEKDAHLEEVKNLLTTDENYLHMNINDMTQIQEKLAYLGYYEGEIDGVYGTLTEQAIKQVHENDDSEKQPTLNNNEKQSPYKAKVVKNNSNIIDTAYSYIGTPYVWGGQSPSGFDCSGFIQHVFKQENKTIPRTTNEIWNFSQHVESPSVGDLIFFETYKPGPSHLGIYLGNEQFIHASTSQGVSVSHLSESYWQDKYIGAKRIN